MTEDKIQFRGKDYLYLGYVNDWWDKPPPEYTKCMLATGHDITTSTTTDCIHTTYCHTCRIMWRMDSSD